jgi:hypothetical protein
MRTAAFPLFGHVAVRAQDLNLQSCGARLDQLPDSTCLGVCVVTLSQGNALAMDMINHQERQLGFTTTDAPSAQHDYQLSAPAIPVRAQPTTNSCLLLVVRPAELIQLAAAHLALGRVVIGPAPMELV